MRKKAWANTNYEQGGQDVILGRYSNYKENVIYRVNSSANHMVKGHHNNTCSMWRITCEGDFFLRLCIDFGEKNYVIMIEVYSMRLKTRLMSNRATKTQNILTVVVYLCRQNM